MLLYIFYDHEILLTPCGNLFQVLECRDRVRVILMLTVQNGMSRAVMSELLLEPALPVRLPPMNHIRRSPETSIPFT